MRNGKLSQLGHQIMCILVASRAISAEASEERLTANSGASGGDVSLRASVATGPASAADQSRQTRPVPRPRLRSVPLQPTPVLDTPDVRRLPDSLPGIALRERCGDEGVMLERFARTHLSSRTCFEVSVTGGVPQLWAVLRVVACDPIVGMTCTVEAARAARLGEHQPGDTLRVRVFVADHEFDACRANDRRVGHLLGFTGAVQTFRAIRRATLAKSDSARRRALPPNTARVALAESARSVAKKPNLGIVARRRRDEQLAAVQSDGMRRLFAVFRKRGMMAVGGERRVSPSVTEWISAAGTTRLRFLGASSRNRDVSKVVG